MFAIVCGRVRSQAEILAAVKDPKDKKVRKAFDVGKTRLELTQNFDGVSFAEIEMRGVFAESGGIHLDRRVTGEVPISDRPGLSVTRGSSL